MNSFGKLHKVYLSTVKLNSSASSMWDLDSHVLATNLSHDLCSLHFSAPLNSIVTSTFRPNLQLLFHSAGNYYNYNGIVKEDKRDHIN